MCSTNGRLAEFCVPRVVKKWLRSSRSTRRTNSNHVRVEACDACKFYLRTIDLTKDGHAIPLVDDLAAIPLTLWAHEHGYSRLQPNLLGT